MRKYSEVPVGQAAPDWMAEEHAEERWRGAPLPKSQPNAQDVMKQDLLGGNTMKAQPSLADIQDMKKPQVVDSINPAHYNDIPAEQQHHRVVVAHGLDWYCSCALKYLMRAGKKSSVGMTLREKEIDDLKKARQYIDMKLAEIEAGRI